MKQIPRSLSFKRVRLVEGTTLSLSVGFLCVGVLVGRSAAEPPQVQLAPPFYSFDGESPTIDPLQDPVTELHADDILKLAEHNPPDLAVPGAALGLGAVGDELDALSSGNPGLDPDVQFLLLLSIDRASSALFPPDEDLVRDDVPYNALEQALKGHASGDQYMVLDEFTRAGGSTSGDGGSRAPATSVQLRNQYNEGGSDFGGEPTSASRPGSRSRDLFPPQDNVVSMMLTGRSEYEYENGLTEAYFSVKDGSPSLSGLPGGGETGDGAYIFYYNANPMPPGPTTTVFASSSALGLTASDDIDAIIVFDTNTNGEFDGNDQVLFSLAPDSPSLNTISQHSVVAAEADVFAVSADGAGPSVFANAEHLGLGGPEDNIDALDYVVCAVGGTEDPNARECALQYGIRGNPVPAVSDWGLVVLTLVVLLTGALMIRRRSSRVA